MVLSLTYPIFHQEFPKGDILVHFYLFFSLIPSVNIFPSLKSFCLLMTLNFFIKVSSLADCIQLQSDLDSFYIKTQRIGLHLNLNKCHETLIHPYSVNSSCLKRVSCVKDLGFYLTPTLSFDHHINITIGKALKVLGFIKRNTAHFSSISCLRSLYYSLVRFILEYGIIVWHPYFAKDQLCIERVQNCFLSYASFVLKIVLPLHDYSPISACLDIPSLASRRCNADINFISSLLNDAIDSSNLLSSISFRVPAYSSREYSLFYVRTHHANFSHNHPIHRMLRLLNNF